MGGSRSKKWWNLIRLLYSLVIISFFLSFFSSRSNLNDNWKVEFITQQERPEKRFLDKKDFFSFVKIHSNLTELEHLELLLEAAAVSIYIVWIQNFRISDASKIRIESKQNFSVICHNQFSKSLCQKIPNCLINKLQKYSKNGWRNILHCFANKLKKTFLNPIL